MRHSTGQSINPPQPNKPSTTSGTTTGTGGTTTTTVTPQPKNAPVKRAFVGWLNGEKEGKLQSTKTKNAKLLEEKFGVKFLDDKGSDKSLSGRRRTAALKSLATEKARIAVLASAVNDVAPKQGEIDDLNNKLEALEKHLDHTDTDLSITEQNEKLLKDIEVLRRDISQTAGKLGIGVARALDEVARIEKHPDYELAEKLDTSIATRLKSIKELFQAAEDNQKKKTAPKVDIPKVLNDLKTLERDCAKLAHEQVVLDGEIQKVVESYGNARKDAQKTFAKPPELLAYVEVVLGKAREHILVARERPAGLKDKTAVDEHAKNVREALAKAEEQIKIVTDLKANPPKTPGDKKKLGVLMTALAEYERDAAAPTPEQCPKVDPVLDKSVIDQWIKDFNTDPTTVGDDKVAKAQKATELVAKHWEDQAQKWTDARTDAAKNVRFGQQIMAAIKLRLDQAGDDEEDKQYKEIKAEGKEAQAGLDLYDQAVKLAGERKYIDAGKELQKAVDKLKVLQDTANDAYEKAVVHDDDLKSREGLFGSREAELTKKSKLRLDPDTMHLMMESSGITVDDEGQLQQSEQFKEMQEQLAKALKLWNDLRSKGVDPFKAADKAFQGIPENFWPIEAVRVLAMFRRAEATFAEERATAELEATLKSSKLKSNAEKVDKAVDIATDYGGKAADHVKDVADGAIKGVIDLHLKNTLPNFKNMTDKEKAKAANEYIKSNSNVDVKQASEILGGLSAGLGALGGMVKVGKSAYKATEATLTIAQFDPETDTTVNLKMAEFERQRAVWQMVDAMADTVLSAIGPATEAVPGLGLVSSIKTLVLSVADAAAYFKRLHEVRNLKADAKYDPETMADLALANEAYKLGVLGSKKTFDAAIAILKIAGGAAELGGISAPGGWALKGTSFILQYCGKGFFAVKDWRKRKSAMRKLYRAKANPSDIDTVEKVFKNCTMYARFALAEGAMNGDSWSRQYLMKRGLTDADMDNVFTTSAILREYMNVTFESVQGEAQEDDDLGQTKREQKEKKESLSQEKFLGTWRADDASPDAVTFRRNYDEAIKSGGLKPDKQVARDIETALKEYAELHTAFDKPKSEFELAFAEFEKSLDPKTFDPQKMNDAVDKAKTAQAKAMDAAIAAGRQRQYAVQLIQSWVPLAQEKDSSKKHKQHEGMKFYLDEMVVVLEDGYRPIAAFREEIGPKSMSLTLKTSTSKGDFIGKAQQHFEQLLAESAKETKKIRDDITNEFDTRFDGLTLVVKCLKKGSGTKAVLASRAKVALEIEPQEIDDQIGDSFKKCQAKYLEMAVFSGFKIFNECQQARKDLETTKPKNLAKALKDIDVKQEKRLKEEAMKAWLDKLAVELSIIFETAINAAYKKKAESNSKLFFNYKTEVGDPVELTREYWLNAKSKMVAKGWEFRKTGIGPALEDFEETFAKVQTLPKDPQMRKAWSEVYGKLLNKLQTWPIDRKDRIEVPGVADLKKALIVAYATKKNEYEKLLNDGEDADPMEGGTWKPSDGQLSKWPATEDGWLLFHEMATNHGWKGHNSRKDIGKLFAKLDDAYGAKVRDDKATAAAAKTLETFLAKWNPDKKLGIERDPFPAATAFRDAMVKRLQEFQKALNVTPPPTDLPKL